MRHKSCNTKPAQASLLKFAKQYWADESGATAIEYSLMSALIGVLLISGFSALGGSLSDKFNEIALLLSGPQDLPQANSVS